MMRALLLSTVLLASSAWAGMSPDPKLVEAFGKLTGKWKCKGKLAMVPGEEMKDAASTLKIAKELGGFVYTAEYERKKTKKLQGVKAKWTWGYDPQRKVLLHTGYDTFSGLEEGKADAMDGLVLTFNVDYSTGATMVKQRLLLTMPDEKEKKKELKLVREQETDDGWVRLSEESCKK